MDFFNIDTHLLELAKQAEKNAAEAFKTAEEIARYNGEKILAALIKNRVSDSAFKGSTGYGYGDVGRELLDSVYADVFGAEDALVRHGFVSGTHALSVALFGILRPGDRMVSVTGKPYDTLEEVIGIKRGDGDYKGGNGSLTDFGVYYEQVELLEGGNPDLSAIAAAVKGARVAYIQRSRGYSLRSALTTSDIAEIVAVAKKSEPNIVVMVDNCYGEFVEKKEPTEVDADLIIGSLIKNAGGGIAETGGYIAGRKDLVEQCAYRLTCVGMGKEVGCTLGQTKPMFMGLFFAPEVVASAVKVATFAAELFTLLGFECLPKLSETRGDIITVLKLKTAENLIAFCEGIQSGSPVDSFVTPVPWAMPGYDSEVIMAAGGFTMGASIELSADAPLREPFAAFLQGGLTYSTGRIGILLAADKLLKTMKL